MAAGTGAGNAPYDGGCRFSEVLLYVPSSTRPSGPLPLDIGADIGASTGCVAFIGASGNAAVFTVGANLVVWAPPAAGGSSATYSAALNSYRTVGTSTVADRAGDFVVHLYDEYSGSYAARKFDGAAPTNAPALLGPVTVATLANFQKPKPVGGLQGTVHIYVYNDDDVYSGLDRAVSGCMATCFQISSSHTYSLLAVDYAQSASPAWWMVGTLPTIDQAESGGSICFTVAPGTPSVVLLTRTRGTYSTATEPAQQFTTYSTCTGTCTTWQASPPFSGALGDAVVL